MQKRIIFILLAAIAMATAPAEVKAENPASKKFTITVNAGFDYSQSKLTSSSSLITDMSGAVESDQTIDKEGLKQLNDANTYKLEQQTLDLRVEYHFIRNASVWLGVGVVTTSMRNSYSAEDEIHTKSASENPNFLLNGGLSYRYNFKGGWFAKLSPSVAWNQSNNNMMSFAQNEESAVYHTYDLDRNVLRWEVPLTVGKTIGKWEPYIGMTYRDYSLKDKFISEVSFVGQDYPIEINDRYSMKSKIGAVAGCTYAIYDYLGININLNYCRNLSGSLSLFFNI